jgi:dephospho-CoA kinase
VRKLGLTGGIASGKSSVAKMFREEGFTVLDADALGHQLIEPHQPAYQEILAAFGPGVAPAGARIDRSKLAAIVFADRSKLDRLNAIVHPRVRAAMLEKFAAWEAESGHGAVLVEAALLVEAGFAKNLDGLIVTWCTAEQQLARLIARGLSETEARRRIASQMPQEEKLRHANYKIDCSASLEETRQQVASLAQIFRTAQ